MRSFALTIALLTIGIMSRYYEQSSTRGQTGPTGEPGLPGEDWNAGLCGPEGPRGHLPPKPMRPYLKQKKGRSNAYHPANRPKSTSR